MFVRTHSVALLSQSVLKMDAGIKKHAAHSNACWSEVLDSAFRLMMAREDDTLPVNGRKRNWDYPGT